MANFTDIADTAKDMGLDERIILKVLILQKYAKDNDIEFYIFENKLRLRKIERIKKADLPEGWAEMFGL